MATPITIIGNLTADPELRFTPNGAPVCNFSVAVNHRVKDGDGWADGEPTFWRINAWRDLAENVAESITKGTRVVVTGRVQARSWETPEGDKRTAVEITADEVAPSLRWATAEVTRKSRNGGDSGPRRQSGGSWDEPPPF
jgi:single-strand DNA-binding protein